MRDHFFLPLLMIKCVVQSDLSFRSHAQITCCCFIEIIENMENDGKFRTLLKLYDG